MLFNLFLAFISFDSRHVANFARTWHATSSHSIHILALEIKHTKVMSSPPSSLFLQPVYKDPVMLVEASSGILYKNNQVKQKHEVS